MGQKIKKMSPIIKKSCYVVSIDALHNYDSVILDIRNAQNIPCCVHTFVMHDWCFNPVRFAIMESVLPIIEKLGKHNWGSNWGFYNWREAIAAEPYGHTNKLQEMNILGKDVAAKRGFRLYDYETPNLDHMNTDLLVFANETSFCLVGIHKGPQDQCNRSGTWYIKNDHTLILFFNNKRNGAKNAAEKKMKKQHINPQLLTKLSTLELDGEQRTTMSLAQTSFVGADYLLGNTLKAYTHSDRDSGLRELVGGFYRGRIPRPGTEEKAKLKRSSLPEDTIFELKKHNRYYQPKNHKNNAELALQRKLLDYTRESQLYDIENASVWELLFNPEHTGFILFDVSDQYEEDGSKKKVLDQNEKENAEKHPIKSSIVGIPDTFFNQFMDRYNRNFEEVMNYFR